MSIISDISLLNSSVTGLRVWEFSDYTTTGHFVVPLDVFCIWVDMVGPGGGGGGGHSTLLGGGGGGGAGEAFEAVGPIPVTAGSTLTINTPRGGLGGAPDTDGGNGSGFTQILNTGLGTIQVMAALGGKKGVSTEGGAGGASGGSFVPGGTGSATQGGGTQSTQTPIALSNGSTITSSGGGGGAVNWPGGLGGRIRCRKGYIQGPAGTGGSSGGGGGGGGCSPEGAGGAGGSNGSAGTAAAYAGAGGGGGSGNSAGAEGGKGKVRIYY